MSIIQEFGNSAENLKTDDIVKIVSDFEKSMPTDNLLKILVLRNFTIEPMVTYLKYFCYQSHISCSVTLGDYDNILQEIIQPDGALSTVKPDIVIICFRLDQFSDRITRSCIGMQPGEITALIKEITDFIRGFLTEIRKKTSSVVLVNNFEVPPYTSLGILDWQNKDSEPNLTRELNRQLIDITLRFTGVFIVDIENLKSIAGYENFIDNRNWYLARLPYSQKALRMIAEEYTKFIRSIQGRTKKCIVLDCDNTLWGGIIGEDSINKIQIGSTYPGCIYAEFQQSILNMYRRGILLAICSKNNENDVLEVFENHPEMILKKEHFVAKKINWNDKVSNIREIAKDLNIGIESLVLVDDNPFEIDYVRQMLPEVEVIPFRAPTGYFYRDILYRSGLFDTVAFSDEDRTRSELYHGDQCRQALKSGSQSLEGFFRDLQMEVIIKNSDAFAIPRIAQLTQKTNQFNLTTKRYTESQIEKFSRSPDWCVRYLEVKDRFGSNGIVGVAILHFNGETAVIDSFLMSCRIIGRSVEEVFLLDCIECAKDRNCKTITGQYIPTKKNEIVKEFYEKQNFTLLNMKDPDEVHYYTKEIQTMDIVYPSYFKSIKRV
jgi:FkbH-like protein